MQITGGQIFDREKGFIRRTLYTDHFRFTDSPNYELNNTDNQVIDASGCYIIPGLIDLHFHGCIGEDFSDAKPDGLRAIANYQLSRGITCLCPASMTLPEEQLAAICMTAADFQQKQAICFKSGIFQGAELAGIHLEGPFLSAEKKGAQNDRFLHLPDLALFNRLQNQARGCIRLITVAPELPGALDFIRSAAPSGIRISLGHTTADYQMACAAFESGASHVTHLYNAMPPFHHREPGVIGAAFDQISAHPDYLDFVELICDGVHIHESVVRATFQLFGPEHVILISDSLRATGMPDGQYPFGGQMIEVHGNRAHMLGHPETIAGSVLDLMGCLRKAVDFGIPLFDAVRACTCNPAQALGLFDRLGSLDAGKDASAVFLDEKTLEIRKILFKGAWV